MFDMRRRDFVALLAGAATCPFPARAQQPAMPVIGFLGSTTREAFRSDLTAFHQGLSETGFVENRNVAIEYRWAEGQNTRLPILLADFVRRQVAAIVVTSNSGALAAKVTISAIPIVFTVGADPVRLGLVASLNRPGGNITGVSVFSDVLIKKRLELLHELVPRAEVIAVLVNPTNPDIEARLRDLQAAALAMGQQIKLLTATSESEIEAAFATYLQHPVGAMLVQNDPFLSDARREQILALAARYRVPAAYEQRTIVESGGLMSYGANRADIHRQVGIYAGRILKGEKPADLPVQQPTKFDLVINLKTAKALGLDVPPTLLARADEVIE